ncbi:DUF3857 domain-containing transglutaminase family protein [soil metagenome]
MILRIRSLSLLVVLGCSFLASDSFARLPKESDLSAVVESETADFDVRKDGTYTLDYEVRIAVLTEAGRDSQAVKNISFNSRASKFELISAKTINDGIETKVAPSNVEIKEVGDSKVFDTTKEAIISFPSVRVGSRIAYHYRLKFSEVPIEGFFSTGMNIDLQNIDVFRRTIRSALPLYVSNHDKMGLLTVETKKDGSKFLVEIRGKNKIRLGVVQEDAIFVDNGRLPSVLVSTMNDWNGFGESILTEQEKLLAAPLPKSLEAIREAAMKEPVARRMAVVAAKVAQEFRYFGDWRRRNGGHLPRPLQEIAETAYGDCKDMSLVVTAIARAMGLKADIAWIWRSDVYLDESYYRLPNDFGFNHAVARVEDGNTVQWIDATNPVAIPGMVFADIGQRPALVLKKSGVVLDRTPDLKSNDSMARVKLGLSMKKGGTFNLSGQLFQKGRAATHAEWALLYVPAEQFQYETARWLARGEKLENYEVTLPKDSSRVVRDLTFDTKFSIGELGLRTTAGIGFPLLRNDTIDLLLVDTRDRFSDVWLGSPGIFEEEYTMPNASIVGRENIGCKLEYDGVKLSRSVQMASRKVSIKTRLEVLKSVIPNASLQTPQYAEFQKRVRRCFNRSAVILSLKPSTASRSSQASQSH